MLFTFLMVIIIIVQTFQHDIWFLWIKYGTFEHRINDLNGYRTLTFKHGLLFLASWLACFNILSLIVDVECAFLYCCVNNYPNYIAENLRKFDFHLLLTETDGFFWHQFGKLHRKFDRYWILDELNYLLRFKYGFQNSEKKIWFRLANVMVMVCQTVSNCQSNKKT